MNIFHVESESPPEAPPPGPFFSRGLAGTIPSKRASGLPSSICRSTTRALARCKLQRCGGASRKFINGRNTCRAGASRRKFMNGRNTSRAGSPLSSENVSRCSRSNLKSQSLPAGANDQRPTNRDAALRGFLMKNTTT